MHRRNNSRGAVVPDVPTGVHGASEPPVGLGSVTLTFAALLEGGWERAFDAGAADGGGAAESVAASEPATAESVASGAESRLVRSVLLSVGRVLCHDTDVVMAGDGPGVGVGGDVDSIARNLCDDLYRPPEGFDIPPLEGGRSLAEVAGGDEGSAAVWALDEDGTFAGSIATVDKTAVVAVNSKGDDADGLDGLSRYRLRWIEFAITYSVLSLSVGYFRSGDSSVERAVGVLEAEVRAAINSRARDGTLGRLLQEEDGRVAGAGAPGDEVWTFGKIMMKETEKTRPQADSGSTDGINWASDSLGDYPYPLQAPPLHPIRVVGIVMFLFVTLSTFFLMHLARRRRRQLKDDKEFLEKGKGGLVCQEGLEHVLTTGWGVATKTSMREIS